MPFIKNTLLVYDLVKLELEVHGIDMKINEQTCMRKDRYSSLSYNYWVQSQLEREVLVSSNVTFDIQQYASGLRKLNHKPTMY